MKRIIPLALAVFVTSLALAAAGCSHKQAVVPPPAPATHGSTANANLPPIPPNAPPSEVQMLQNSSMPPQEKEALIKQMSKQPSSPSAPAH
jgi:hypothetical protein